MMKKFLSFALVLAFVCLGACVAKETETKDETPKDKVVTDAPDVKDDKAEDKTPEEKSANEEKTAEETRVETPAEMIARVGAVASEGGTYKDDAVRLCDAIVGGDAEVFAGFADGKPEYYDFLSAVEISSYTLYPFELTEEKLQELGNQYQYPAAQDNYFVEFDVASSECEEFTVGKCCYYIGLEMNAMSGNLLSVFVPMEKAEEKIVVSYENNFTEWFIKEFAALYSGLDDGRNYADSFDFSGHPHLITHIMARSGKYGDPPYTKAEINTFIGECFEGNQGLDNADFANGMWTNSYHYGENNDPEKIYGCSWGHGGTSVVYDTKSIETDGDREIRTVDVYADFARVAKAYTLVFHFTGADDDYPCLTMVEKRDVTERQPAVWSV